MIGNPFSSWYGELEILSTKFDYENSIVYDNETKTLVSFRANRKSFVVPEYVMTIGEAAFSSLDSLCEVIIPEGVTSIGVRAFWLCSSLSRVILPNSLTNIGEGAFKYCI